MKKLRILVLDDSPADAELSERALRKGGIQFVSRRAANEAELRTHLERFAPDVVLADFAMPGFSGPQAVAIVRAWRSDVPCILVSGALGEDLAVEALHSGATDYVLKQHMERLAPAVNRAVAEVDATRARAELEEQLRQAQKLEAIGRLAGGIAHDFNNLVTAIRGFADLAAGALPEGHPARDDIGQIRQAATRAAELTRHLLAFSRRQIVAPEVVDLGSAVEALAPMLRRLIGEQTTLVTRSAGDDLCVMIDPSQLEQILLNLVLNARDAMPTGGSVTIATEPVEATPAELSTAPPAGDSDEPRPGGQPGPGGTPGGPAVALVVSDTGVGMDRRTLGHIFEPFFTTKSPGEGTGLGLATVYGNVHKAEGTIQVRSEPGEGTTIRILLPRVAANARAAIPDARAPTPSSNGETILVVEDEDAVRAIARRVLIAAGYAVLDAPNAPAALAIAEASRTRLDLLFTDVVMPGGTGHNLALQLTAERPDLQVLFASGYTDDESIRADALRRGWQYLAKPYAASELLDHVRAALDRQAARGRP